MHTRRLAAALSLAAMLLTTAARADEFDGVKPLTNDQMAKIRAEQEMIKEDAIDGSKGDDTYDTIHEAKKQIRHSLDKALEDNGVSKVQYMREYTRTDRATKDVIESKAQAIKDQARSDQEAKAHQEAADAADRKEHPYGHRDQDEAPAPAAKAEPAEAGPEVIRGYKDGDSVTIPSKVDANGEKTPEIILGFDEEHSPGATAKQNFDPNAASAPVPVDPPR